MLQSASSECGLACAGMLINHFRDTTLSLQDLRRRHDVNLRGLNLNSLINILSENGILARPLSVGLNKLKALKLPCIIHWRFNHYVILEEIRGARFHVVDPGCGRRILGEEEVNDNFTGIALEVVRLEDDASAIKPGRRLKLQHLLPPLSTVSKPLLQVLALTLALNAVTLATPLFLKLIFDRALPESRFDILLALTASFLLLAVLQSITQYYRGAGLVDLRRNLSEGVSCEVFAHLVWLNGQVIERRSAGTIATNYRSVMTLTDTLSEEVLGTIVDGLSGIALLVVLFVLDPVIGLAMTLVIALYAGYVIWRNPERKSRLAESLAAEGREGGYFVETINRLQPIRLFEAENLRTVSFNNLHSRLEDARQAHGEFSNAMRAFGEFILGVGWVLVIALAASRVLGGDMTTGSFAAIVVWVGLAIARGRETVSRLAQMDALETHVDRVADIIQGKSDRPDRARSGGPFPRLEGLGCRDLSFRYGEHSDWVLRDCDFHVKQGEWKAIAGRSGEGKSTLVKLLTGMIAPTHGEIIANGAPLHHDQMSQVRRRLGVVMQNDGLFGGSIRDNITFFDTNPDIDHMEACADVAGIRDDIDRMPMKFESAIGEQGAGVSAGQLQRLMLARALYRRPNILILDEFSANLDEQSEAQIIRNLKQLAIGVVTIAHRSAVINAADEIYRLEAGRLRRATRAATAAGPIFERVVGGSDAPS
jgi:ATP-binding cassette subfamily B protein RaxB